MKNIAKVLITTTLSLLILSKLYSQVFSIKSMKGTYVALCAETLWVYNFDSNNTYNYQTSGHFGNSNTKGHYKISKDTIILTAFPKKIQEDQEFFFRTDTLIIENDKCLVNLHTGYEHLLKDLINDTIFTSKRRNLNLANRPIVNED